MILPTLTIMQPYGKKRFETRYRRTSKRGLVAIHAGRGQYAPPTDEAQEKYFELIRQSKELTGISFPCLPRGYIVGVAQLVACEYIIDANEERAILTDKRSPEIGCMEIRGEELQFGDFRKGRYAWIFENFFAAPEPIAALGKQGWWKTEVPDGWGK